MKEWLRSLTEPRPLTGEGNSAEDWRGGVGRLEVRAGCPLEGK